MNQNQTRLVQEFAIGITFADLGGLTYDAIMESLSDDIIPEECSVWAPFEWQDAKTLLETIENMEMVLEDYGKQVIAAN